ncbi:inovirus Gp2 family protein [Providencia rettgeri]|nr:inovirus Gp2 family protein [Providencia rettgeri]
MTDPTCSLAHYPDNGKYCLHQNSLTFEADRIALIDRLSYLANCAVNLRQVTIRKVL